jgi:hypothetical protein
MIWIPGPAAAGSNVPAAPDVIPVPDQVPPPVAALRLKAGALRQIAGG